MDLYQKYKKLLRQLLESETFTGHEGIVLDQCRLIVDRLAYDRKQSAYLQKLDELDKQYHEQIQELKAQFFPKETH